MIDLINTSQKRRHGSIYKKKKAASESLSLLYRQVFHTYTDSPRERKCPFEDQNLDGKLMIIIVK